MTLFTVKMNIDKNTVIITLVLKWEGLSTSVLVIIGNAYYSGCMSRGCHRDFPFFGIGYRCPISVKIKTGCYYSIRVQEKISDPVIFKACSRRHPTKTPHAYYKAQRMYKKVNTIH